MKREGLIINVLKDDGILSEAQRKKAQQLSIRSGKGMLETIQELRWISDKQIRDVLAHKFAMDTVDLKGKEIPNDALKLISASIARKYQVIPLEKKGHILKAAISDPFKLEVIDSLALILNMQVEGVLVTHSDIQWALYKYYNYNDIEDNITSKLEKAEGYGENIVDEKSDAMDGEISSEAPIIKLVSFIISQAFRKRASDIHLEPMADKFRIRYRIDGMLYEQESPPKNLQNSIISRIKIMSNMSIDEKRLPQDGRIRFKILSRNIDLRVSTLPSRHGESVVMRILDKENLLLGLPQLGLMSDDEKKFEHLINMPNGIILITGPTGSGKTTTLYACLNHINRPDKKIITVEDPIEYLLTGINQVQVKEEINLTFSNILRSILRQAPDIIMIGEIRDLETANIAVHASLTGHLVFSTLHTNDAPSAVTRLIDQGVKPFLIASSVQGIVAQRLVRVICPKCKKPYVPSNSELLSLGLDKAELEQKDITFWRGAGCDYCNHTGYYGRIGIFELIVVDDELRKLIYKNAPSHQIRQRARQLGMKTLKEDGLLKVYAGVTTVDEILKVALE